MDQKDKYRYSEIKKTDLSDETEELAEEKGLKHGKKLVFSAVCGFDGTLFRWQFTLSSESIGFWNGNGESLRRKVC